MSEAGALKLASGGSALVAFQTPQDEVQAFDAPISSVSGPGGTVGGTVPATLSLSLGAAGRVRAVHPGHREGLLRDHHRNGHLDRG